MKIALARIDNRLIHGQVMEAWVPYVNADCIVVANDEVASSPLKRAMMEACVPRCLQLFIGSLEEISAQIQNGTICSSKTLLLFENSHDALKVFRRGVHYKRLNLGNMHASQGKVAVTCTLCIDGEDVVNLKELESSGVEISAQCIPQDTAQSWHKLRVSWEKSSSD
ncbi:MAG: PTS N-acetylgalactosamine transporter subunit IIB [Desulfuromonas sp.]|nr:MAG: PTS N-acetylgalactosamine transporter subunit IIB [Desulfuromonas sp.]